MSVGMMAGFATLLFAALGNMVATAAQASQRQPDGFEDCALPGVERVARCGTMAVPEDWEAPNGRTIAIGVAIVPATDPAPERDPIVILMGGPGESAIEDASVFARWLAPVLDKRDLVLIDQRGAGASAPLTCPIGNRNNPAPLLADSFPPAAIKACTVELAKTADLTKYGFPEFARDLEHIRRRLGYGRLNLFAGSYGTRAAQVFLRAYPQSVRTAYLGSVVPIDIVAPLTMAKTAQLEIDRLFDDCEADSRCAESFPRLRSEFDAVMRQLDQGHASVTFVGSNEAFAIRTAPAAAWIRARLYRPSSAAILPWAIHRAYLGDWNPIANGILAAAESGLGYGLFFAITCNEDMRFIDRDVIEKETRNTFMGASRVHQQQAGCRFWPSSRLPPRYREPIRSDVPTLFVTGQADGGTPVWFTDHAAKTFSNAAILLAPGQGHTEWSPCIAARYFSLIRQGLITGPKHASCPVVQRPPFKTG